MATTIDTPNHSHHQSEKWSTAHQTWLIWILDGPRLQCWGGRLWWADGGLVAKQEQADQPGEVTTSCWWCLSWTGSLLYAKGKYGRMGCKKIKPFDSSMYYYFYFVGFLSNQANEQTISSPAVALLVLSRSFSSEPRSFWAPTLRRCSRGFDRFSGTGR